MVGCCDGVCFVYNSVSFSVFLRWFIFGYVVCMYGFINFSRFLFLILDFICKLDINNDG